MEKELTTNVWSISGFLPSYKAGILALNNNMVAFITKKGEEFHVPLSDIKIIKWPKLQFGYGVHLDVKGKTYKLTFAQPNGENALDPGMITDFGRIAGGVDSIRGLLHLKDYKANANQWREVLQG